MRMSFQIWQNLVIGALVLVLGVVVGQRYQPIPGLETDGRGYQSQQTLPSFNVLNTQAPEEFKDVDFDQFWEVWRALQQEYLDSGKLDQEKMLYGAIRGMTAALEDPYTVYLPPEQDQRAAEDLAGSFYGVGIELGYIDNTLAVVAPLKGMPADQAGVKAGDLILHVRDEAKGLDADTSGWSLSEAVDNIRGRKNTPVILTLFRRTNGAEPFDVELVRDEIVIPTVEVETIEHDGKRVAHLQLFRFGERTEGEWNEAILKIRQEKDQLDGIVLDMRNNPGGYFDGAIQVASEFIEGGTIVTQQGKFNSRDFEARGNALLADEPLAVVVNRGSASASEIVAGALRDQRGVSLVGEQTFGKGTVQDRKELDGEGGLHVTIARWLLPGGDWIHDGGIPVNIEVTDNPDTPEDEVVLRAIEAL